MRVLQVVTLITPDGAYGGPVRVAFNQAQQLRSKGYDALIVATARGYSPLPRELNDTPVRLSKARLLLPFAGFSGIVSPSMLWWMLRHRRDYDVVHVHLARDLVTLPAAM